MKVSDGGIRRTSDPEVDSGRYEIRFTGPVVRRFRNWLGVWVPPSVTRRLGTKAQIAVAGRVNQIETRQRVVVAVTRVSKGPDVAMPTELAAALKRDLEARKWWEALSESKHRIAMTWIGQAKSADVRNYRVSDVLRRARRAYVKEGPFYPTKEDQPLLSRPKLSTAIRP